MLHINEEAIGNSSKRAPSILVSIEASPAVAKLLSLQHELEMHDGDDTDWTAIGMPSGDVSRSTAALRPYNVYAFRSRSRPLDNTGFWSNWSDVVKMATPANG